MGRELVEPAGPDALPSGSLKGDCNMGFINQATISAVLSFLSTISIALGKPAIGVAISNPDLATGLTAVFASGMAILAAFSKPPAPPAPKA